MTTIIKYGILTFFVFFVITEYTYAASVVGDRCNYSCAPSYICRKGSSDDKYWPSNRYSSSCGSGCKKGYTCQGYYQSCTSPCYTGTLCTNNSTIPTPEYTCTYIDYYNGWSACVNNSQYGINPHYNTKTVNDPSECRDVTASRWCPSPPPIIPSCTFTYSPNTLPIGSVGSVQLNTTSDVDSVASCRCTGLDSPGGAFNVREGAYAQGPFASAGTKSCTCTVVSTTGHSATCSGSLTSTVPPTCTGSIPSGSTMCSGDNVSLTTTLSWQYAGTSASACTGRKCEYYTVPITYSCTGALPANATLCGGDNTGLSVNVMNSLVDTCTAGTKCEYVCNAGYYRSGNTCIPYVCTGALPTNATPCLNDSNGLTIDTTWLPVVSCTARKCEYTVPTPTLTLTANPNTITNGESSTITWTTANTSSCWAQDPTAPWRGWKIASGSTQFVTPTSTTTYDLECWNDAGVSTGRQSVTITVNQPTYQCENYNTVCPSGTSICPGDGSGESEVEGTSWRHVGSSWNFCDDNIPCECYRPSGTVGNNNNEGSDGRIIETRP